MRKKKEKITYKIAAFDCETRGFFGDIFKVGYYDGVQYLTFNTGSDFIKYLLSLDNICLYGFNLEFDLSKILAETAGEFELNFNGSLFINNRVHVAKIKNKEIIFRDIYPLVNCSLDAASKSFDLKNKKIELQLPAGMDKEEYFETVPADDPVLFEYLEADVRATYELVFELMFLSKLSQPDFLKCVSTASLAMKVFKTQFQEDFLKVKYSQQWTEMEEFLREGYFGGRTEVFRPEIKDGYHYDINSLYPYVMEQNFFPVGRWRKINNDLPFYQKMEMLEGFHRTKENNHYMIKAKVYIPDQFYPPLPVRRDGKLIYPVGTVVGYWYRPEFEYALKHCDVKILEIYDLAYCFQADTIFRNFIQNFKEMKMNSVGGKRYFAKTMQNSLYGKMGMHRERNVYENFDETKKKELEKKDNLVGVFQNIFGKVMSYNKFFFADYITPQFSALITSYARLELLKSMKAVEKSGDHVYYCDTDAIVCKNPLPLEIVDKKEYGKWKLEREIKEGIYILPKLYAEVDIKTGEEILKSKGIIKAYMETVKYSSYLHFYECLKNKKDVALYGYGTGIEFYGRRKIITALKEGSDLNERVRLNKGFSFSKMSHKRIFDYPNNTSKPIILNE